MWAQARARSSGATVLARLIAILVGLTVVVLSASPAQAVAPDDESYPPDAIVNLIDPFGCDPEAAMGEIGAVQPGSVVTLQVILVRETAGILRQAAPAGDILGSATFTAGSDGQLVYSIPIEQGRYGSVVVYATGTDSVGNPFALQTAGEIVRCPEQIPRTGSNTRQWVQVGLAAILVGVILVAATRRRRVRTSS
jgi:hypothetical protein